MYKPENKCLMILLDLFCALILIFDTYVLNTHL